MFGAPNSGTEIARAGSRFALSVSAKQMKLYDEWLEKLNRDWVAHVVNGGNPEIEVSRRLTNLCCMSVIGECDWVVPAASGANLVQLGELKSLNKGHIALSKAANASDSTYRILHQFISNCLNQAHRNELRTGAAILQDRVRRKMLASKDWAKTEEETVAVTPLPAQTNAQMPGQFSFHIKSVLGGVAPPSSYRLGIRLKEQEYPQGMDVDYDYFVGPGFMNKHEFDEIAGTIDDSPSSRSKVDGLVKLISMEAISPVERRFLTAQKGSRQESDGSLKLLNVIPR